MPNRILKESICTSETVDALTWFEEVFFYRLIVNCDDFGRIDGRASILKGRLFPLKSIGEKALIKALDKLTETGLILPYEYDDKPYLQIVTWEDHQSIRNQKSKYPAVDGGIKVKAEENVAKIRQLKSIEINCKQVNAIAHARAESNPIQSNPNPNPNPIPPIVPKRGFEEFWKAYPRKVKKQEAIKSWEKIKPNNALTIKIIQAVEDAKLSKQWQKDNGQFIPHPTTWLNQGRWDDEYETNKVDCPL